jgi:benzoate/toluate 1,2-dioxygenase beta subunit
MDPVHGALRQELEAFVLHEARLLDERRFPEWLELFAEDALYWVPATQDEPALALFHETRPLLAMRVARLGRSDMHVQAPPSKTLHHVGSIEVAGELEVRSALIMAEWRAGETRWFAGRVMHRLRREAAGLRIVLKRVDLIDSEGPQRALAVPF